MEQIKIGQITSAVGLKGEVKVYPYIKDPGRFSEIEQICVEKDRHAVTGVRYMKNMVILKLSGIQDRNQAEAQKGKNLYLDPSQMWDMGEDTYLVRDLVGMKVLKEDGTPVGTLVDVVQNSSQDLYRIQQEDGGAFLLPAVKEFILYVDVENARMTVKLIEGMTEL